VVERRSCDMSSARRLRDDEVKLEPLSDLESPILHLRIPAGVSVLTGYTHRTESYSKKLKELRSKVASCTSDFWVSSAWVSPGGAASSTGARFSHIVTLIFPMPRLSPLNS
jgi:hypothetical protein